MKKLIKTPFIFTILLAALSICFGQEKPQAVLFDSFGEVTCEDVLGRSDSLMYALMNDPTLQGYAVIHPGKSSPKKAFFFEKIIKGGIHMRRFDKSRINIIRSNEAADETYVEFWTVPPGAEKTFVAGNWAEAPLNFTKPFVFTRIWVDDSCPLFIPEEYAELIRENRNLRGYIVIFDDFKKQARATMREWRKIFIETHRIPRHRLRFFFARSRLTTDVEFWIVPQKRKKPVIKQ
jgi:hypothetical protein